MTVVVLALPPTVRGDAPHPYVSVGDLWKYDMQSTIVSESGTLSLAGTLSLEIVAEETVSLKGAEYETYKFKTSGSGNAGVSGVSGTWTISGAEYQRRSDFASVKSTSTTQFSFTGPGGSISLTQIEQNTNDPPISSYDFPLSVGKSWIASLSRTSNVTTWSTLDPTPVSNVTTVPLSRTYTVLKSETVTVAAGSFETYVVESSDALATITDYYSPNVGNTVKAVIDYPDGSTLNLLLRDYKAWPYRGSSSVSAQGQTYTLGLRTNVEFLNLQQNATSISFQVDGLSGVTGKADVEIPRQLNSTNLKVYVDSTLVSATVSRNSTHYVVSVTFSLSSHTITVVFAESARSFTSILSNPPILAGIAAAAVAVIVAVLLVVRRRKPPPEQLPTPVESPVSPGPSHPEAPQPSEAPPTS